MADNCVELGFVEEVDNPCRLTSPFFPSKVGGKPVWLARINLPDSQSLLCKNCGKPLVFLLQVYVPSEEEDSAIFHRTIFVFCCRDEACYKANNNQCFAAFRCQLPRINEFYDSSEIVENPNENFLKFQEKESEMTWSPLCDVCGCSGDKRCGRCHLKRYCSKEHQTLDWKRKHKMECCKVDQVPVQEDKGGTSLLFPEYELVTEPEQLKEEKVEKGDGELMKDYEKHIKGNISDEMKTVDDKEWELLGKESKNINSVVKDRVYLEFKKRISPEPDQVLRYQRNGQPLWVSKSNMVEESAIPKCPCGAGRTFEFQILPQLLNHLKVDSLEASIDWGTLVVYTCSKDCSSQSAYSEEFVWKQDFSETGLPADILSHFKK